MINVLFDMDGVLVDSEIYSLKAWSKCLLPQDLIPLWRLCLGVTAEDEYNHFYQRLGWSKLQYQQFCTITSHYIPVDIPFKRGSLELVNSLKPKCRLAVVSSSSEHKIKQRLGRYIDLFDCIISGDNLKHGKPDPEIYYKAMETLNVFPEDCWVIEDSPNGIESARHAGIHNLIYVVDTVPYQLPYTDVIVANGSLLNLKSWIQGV